MAMSMRQAALACAAAIAVAGFLCAADRPAAAVKDASGREHSRAKRLSAADLKKLIKKLEPLHEPLGKPGPGDWLASHHEDGQTFDEYLAGRPVTAVGKRNKIYIRPLGDFSPKQREIVKLTADFMSRYFDRAVVVAEDLPLSLIPKQARRVHPEWGTPQILTSYVLESILKPRLPADAAACLALTTSDLWPDKGWNFVFGEASLRDRVGVWSLSRNGNPADGEQAFRVCLGRALRTATHETGHMFSLKHCTLYECNMCGSNNREEADRRPLCLCPQCTAKICWATGADPLEQFNKLGAFCREHGFAREAEHYAKAAAALDR